MVKRILILLGLAVAIVCGGLSYSFLHEVTVSARTTRFNANLDDLFDELQKYREFTGSYPMGNNADVMRALAGNNTQKVIVDIGRRRKNLNSKGELVDPWGTPYRIYFSGEGVLIRSAGPNKRFDDSTVQNSDDLYRSN